jgi:hypothetical protein
MERVAQEPLDFTLSAAEKLEQALEMMSAGFRLKRVSLRRQFPQLSEQEIEQLLTAWLQQDG